MNWKLPTELRWRADWLDSTEPRELCESDLVVMSDQFCEAAHEIVRLRAEVESLRTPLPRRQIWNEIEAEEGDQANG